MPSGIMNYFVQNKYHISVQAAHGAQDSHSALAGFPVLSQTRQTEIDVHVPIGTTGGVTDQAE